MGERTKIAWCDATWNPIIGCTKIATGCLNCYAERDFDHRRKRAKWGPGGTRVKTSDANWAKPLKWDREASCAQDDWVSANVAFRSGQEGVLHPGERPHRPRVFCASLCDVFEDWKGHIRSSSIDPESKENPVLWWRRDLGIVPAGGTTIDHSRGDRPATMQDVREAAYRVWDETPNLDWLVLTKRPGNIPEMWRGTGEDNGLGTTAVYRRNVWLGCSASTQADLDENVPLLAKCRDLSPLLFISLEPLVELVELRKVLRAYPIGWVIVGGESGPAARPCYIEWIKAVVAQRGVAGVPCFVKQAGENVRGLYLNPNDTSQDAYRAVRFKTKDRTASDPAEWPEWMRVRQFPTVAA